MATIPKGLFHHRCGPFGSRGRATGNKQVEDGTGRRQSLLQPPQSEIASHVALCWPCGSLVTQCLAPVEDPFCHLLPQFATYCLWRFPDDPYFQKIQETLEALVRVTDDLIANLPAGDCRTQKFTEALDDLFIFMERHNLGSLHTSLDCLFAYSLESRGHCGVHIHKIELALIPASWLLKMPQRAAMSLVPCSTLKERHTFP